MSNAPPRPWLFAFASLPYGIFNGVIALSLPYVLRQHGVPVQRIASIGAVVQAPAIWYFLWAPVVDLRLRRRTWIMILAAGSGLCTALALGLDMTSALGAITVLLVAASVLSQPITSALGGLVAEVVPNEERGRTAGWGQAGMLCGGVLAGALLVWLAAYMPTAAIGLVAGLLIAVPSVVVLTIHEPKRVNPGVRERVARMRRELRETFSRRDVWLAIAFFVSPVGSAALMSLFSAVAVDYHASATVVIAVGIGGGLLTAIGALAGGFLADRFNRWRIYPVAGLLAGACAGAMLLGPLTSATFIAGALAYSLAAGFGYAAFMALALELLAEGKNASGTRFTLFIAATNVPLVYMMWIEGVGHAHYGVRGMVAIDAAANALFGLFFLVVLTRAKPVPLG
jgi:MFS transporter, PAT family, beta-lactamase induction signal transducer AmpG